MRGRRVDINFHRLSAEHLAALATSGGGAAAIDVLRRSQHSKHVLLLHAIADASPAVAGAWDLLSRVQRENAEAAAEVVRYPAVGAWAYRTVLALQPGPGHPGAAPGGLAAVAAAAAIKAGVPAELDVPARRGMVTLPSLGTAELPATDRANVLVTRDGVEIRGGGRCLTIPPDRHAVPGWRPLRTVLPGLVVDDSDPFRMPAAPHVATVPDLGPWRPVFADARALLRQHHPEVAAEVETMVTVVVPLGKPRQGQVSSSSPETFGAIAMSEPPEPVDLAATLTHETQHIKLSAVLDLVRLIEPDNGTRYYAPWREDPRPANGLLQGAYAFLGVTAFWRRQRHVAAGSLAETEFARWRHAVALTCETLLASGRLTSDGQRFVGVMAETVRPWLGEPVTDETRRLAEAENALHVARWTAQHGPVPVSG
jgi:HEXXH motif-containing protein